LLKTKDETITTVAKVFLIMMISYQKLWLRLFREQQIR
jgi:hypothetical protein